MQELGTSVQLSQSALSRVVARLEADGLVTRAMCADDRRGIYVELTEERSRPARRRGPHAPLGAGRQTELSLSEFHPFGDPAHSECQLMVACSR